MRSLGVNSMGKRAASPVLGSVLLIVTLLLVPAVLVAETGPRKARVKDVATIEGIRDNQLVGYGLVVGLRGTPRIAYPQAASPAQPSPYSPSTRFAASGFRPQAVQPAQRYPADPIQKVQSAAAAPRAPPAQSSPSPPGAHSPPRAGKPRSRPRMPVRRLSTNRRPSHPRFPAAALAF